MKFKRFAELLSTLEQTNSRNSMTEILSGFMQEFDNAEETKQAMYLLQGRLVPMYVALEFNLSRKLLLRSLAEVVHIAILKNSDQDPAIIVNKLFGELGDEGLVAERLLADRKVTKDLNISEVYDRLTQIAKFEGKGSQESKVNEIGKLLLDVDPLSAKYIARVVIGNLRLGLSEKTVLDALSWAKVGNKSLRDEIERAFGAHADIGELCAVVLSADNGDLRETLEKIKLEPGVPVASKLVEREKTSKKVFERMGKTYVQPKLDGLRAQIHLEPKFINKKDEERVHIFSRNMENLTEMFPDIVKAILELDVDSIILDSEAIGYDYEEKLFLPFQSTMQRRRKYDVGEMSEEIPVKAMAFDVMYLNGKDLSQETLEVRIDTLRSIVGKQDGVIDMLETKLISTEEELESYFQEQVGEGLEGIIIKKLGTIYEPGTRNFDWIKLKANTQSHLVDTVDTVILGYYHGRGVRAKFGIGALLVGLYDKSDGKFYSVAKVGTGMKDDDWKVIRDDLAPLEIAEKPDYVMVEKLLYPDVWVKPTIVMEVDADEITRSPSHTVAREIKASFEKDITEKKGLSLRFPRMKVWNRDKKAEDSTSVEELLRMFELRRG